MYPVKSDTSSELNTRQAARQTTPQFAESGQFDLHVFEFNPPEWQQFCRWQLFMRVFRVGCSPYCFMAINAKKPG
jgi:hypothetical protein